MTVPVTGGPSPSASKFSQHFSHENKRQTGPRKPEPLPGPGPGAKCCLYGHLSHLSSHSSPLTELTHVGPDLSESIDS